MKKSNLAALLILVVALFPGAVSAASKGITLSPFQQTVTIQPTDTEKSFDVTIANNTSAVQDISLQPLDFGTLDDTGGLLLAGSDSRYSQKYGLASWMSLGTDTVILNPGESQVVPVTIVNRQSLQPGGHYGAVVARVNSLDDQKDNKVIINQQLLSLVFVDKVGGEKYDLRLKGFSHNGSWFTLPTKVVLRFQNPGNVHVLPRGVVELKSPNGTVLAKGIINSESAFVLPESFRSLTVNLTPVGSSLPVPGLYKIDVAYRYDGISANATKSYYIRFLNISGIVLLIVLLIIGVFGYKKIRSKKRHK